MIKYKIKLQLYNGPWHTYIADNFIVIDSKLEVFISGGIVSYDFELIENILIKKQEESDEDNN